MVVLTEGGHGPPYSGDGQEHRWRFWPKAGMGRPTVVLAGTVSTTGFDAD